MKLTYEINCFFNEKCEEKVYLIQTSTYSYKFENLKYVEILWDPLTHCYDTY